ncbi:ArsR family transcriptional regulator [Marinimicrobium koreense]|uniref:ArsR family transcriptional regulator n=1 Tax=Marinimicrobium koreense TaxID=306545 RepID=A0A3N1NLM8_9GAMM|nr:metalloregulator ArsR/SmtB family transcription factor [Marinimicrobium koreense]ROQ20694.1 ArsR family transcriptional regulator [Marinimicrobium koreense]
MNALTAGLEEMQAHSRDAADLLKQMSNEHRLMVLCTLGAGEMSVGELNEHIPLSQSALSQHLANLRRAGLVATRKESQTVYYRLAGDKAMRVIRVLQSIYCPGLMPEQAEA